MNTTQKSHHHSMPTKTGHHLAFLKPATQPLVKIQTRLLTTKAICIWGGIVAVTLAAPATAQTVFQTLNGAVNTAANWDNGLPTIASGNQGTIGINATYIGGSGGPTAGQFVGWNVLQTDGTFSRVSGSATLNISTGSTFVVNGASAQFNYSGIALAGATYTMTNGTGTAATGTGARGTTIDNTSTMTFNGGSSTFNREITLTGNGTFTVNGGNLTITGGATAAETGFKSSGAATTGGFFFNGGTTVAPYFNLVTDARTAKFGGTTAGSLSLASLGTNITLDWLSGSLMTLTITGANQAFYEGLWTATTLRFNGANSGAFSDYFQVAGSTLSLISGSSSGQFNVSIQPNATTPGNYDFTWTSQAGKQYDLVTSTDLATAIGTWPVWDGRSDLAATPPNNVLANVPGGGDSRRFFAVVERNAPALFAENFDAAAALPVGWTSNGPVNGTNWEVGVPTGVATGPSTAFSLPNCAGTNIGGYYTENVNVSLVTPAIAIPANAGATLSFRQLIDTDGFGDFGAVRVLDADNADAPIVGLALTGLAGEGVTWTENSLVLPALNVGGKNIKIEFNFISNAGTSQDIDVFGGFYVDDVSVSLD
jgi:hypothetical protein